MEFALLAREISRWIDRENGRGAAPSDISLAEEILAVPIDGHYREFLATFGWIRLGSMEVFGLGHDVPRHLDLLEITASERQEMYPPLPHALVPFWNDGAGNLYCIDTVSGSTIDPPVVIWDHELGVDQTPERVAPSFGEWLLDQLKYAQSA